MRHASAAETALEWLARFEREQGRALRVLHVGNIANNAYNNAKIQRRRGIDADVSCHDYFHIMACPEWEDAEFEGDVVDDLYPDWWNVDLHGFRRPHWFAQGSLRTVQRYLEARTGGGPAALWWNVLTVERWLWCRATPIARALGYRGGVATWIRVLRGLGHVAVHKSGDTIRAATGLVSGSGLRKAALTIFPTRLAGLDPASAFDTTEIGETFSRLFPERSPLCRGDLRPYRQQARSWADVLKAYDVVQGYATEGIVPLLCGTAAWAAYEHGTLREIPFQDSTTGRVAALTYALAPIVFVTNSDVIPSAERLGLDDRHIVFLPHAVDSDRLFRFADEHGPASPPPSDEIILYAPSRQDWIDGDVSLSKGNDRFLRAAAALCDRYAFRLVLAEWGRDLDATRALLEELGLAERVEWVSPLRKRDLWLRYLSSHAVVDQFSVGALGGVAFEAMALGRRVITALDGPNAERFFGEAPPVLAAQTETEIAAALTAVLDDPDDAAGRGAAARAWFAKRHSADRIVELQAAAYRRLLEKALAPAAVDA